MMVIKETKNYPLRIMFHLDHAYQKSITYIDKEEDLGVVMPMYNMLEYSGNYSIA